MAKSRGRIFLGVLVVVVVLVVGFFLYLKFGPLPVAVADSPLPFERQMVKIPLRARIGRQTEAAPFYTSEELFESGAHIYQEHCSFCHGIPGHDSSYVGHMYPTPPQLWKKHGTHGVVGVSDDEAGFSYWIITNGIRLSGMPSFRGVLSETEIWQVSLLLKNADKDLSPQVQEILKSPGF